MCVCIVFFFLWRAVIEQRSTTIMTNKDFKYEFI